MESMLGKVDPRSGWALSCGKPDADGKLWVVEHVPRTHRALVLVVMFPRVTADAVLLVAAQLGLES